MAHVSQLGSVYDRILRQPLPTLLNRKDYRTTSSAWNGDIFIGRIAFWNIVSDVHNTIAAANTEEHHFDDVAAWATDSRGPEYYLCGDEQTLCGRYGENALRPSTAVAFSHGVETHFGDFKSSKEGKNTSEIPDFAGSYTPRSLLLNLRGNRDLPNPEPQLRIVGEAKTFWKHSLKRWFEEWRLQGDSHAIKKALGQIASYMHTYSMKYAFLTTYKHTIFLKQDMNQEGNIPILYVSTPVDATASPPPGSRDFVSVRQCLYYLLVTTRNTKDAIFVNHLPMNEWIVHKDISKTDDTPSTPSNEFALHHKGGTLQPDTEDISHMLTDRTKPLGLYPTVPGTMYTITIHVPSNDIVTRPGLNSEHITIQQSNIMVKRLNDDIVGDRVGWDQQKQSLLSNIVYAPTTNAPTRNPPSRRPGLFEKHGVRPLDFHQQFTIASTRSGSASQQVSEPPEGSDGRRSDSQEQSPNVSSGRANNPSSQYTTTSSPQPADFDDHDTPRGYSGSHGEVPETPTPGQGLNLGGRGHRSRRPLIASSVPRDDASS
ncbi:hypothetical protein FQN50_005622 [Emmonsiellopsis sp. PD_5]|nr:hypothetical protein FQN50_005622 [Emmonsiellopsis sp. PD_5]